MSRTALDGFPLGDIEKEYFVNLVKKLSCLYFCEIIGFCFMGNHFHLLVRMYPDTDFTDVQIKERYERYFGGSRQFFEGQVPTFRQKWSSLSEFMKEIKQTFSRFYNKRYSRRGFFWGDRFKSVLVENGASLINCLAYIDLNPVRAGIVERPEDYRWNSLGYHIQTNNKDDFLSLDFGLIEFGVLDAKERLQRYRKHVYETGAIDKGKGQILDEEIIDKERDKEFEVTHASRFKYRTRYFSDSCIIGSREFVKENYLRFKDFFQSKNKKEPKRINGLDGLYSLKRLTE